MLQEKVNYWKTAAADDWDTSKKLLVNKKYHHSLFFVHLALEKLLKGIILKQTQEPPPYTHDLLILADKTEIHPDKNMQLALAEIATFNISARYDDYKFKFYKKATPEYTGKWFKKGSDLYTYFLSFYE